jgi:hypothetical protein
MEVLYYLALCFSVLFLNFSGDMFQNVARRGLINIACGPGGSTNGNPSVMPVSFAPANGHTGNEPYIYTLDITSPVACGGIGGMCRNVLLFDTRSHL